MTRCGVTAPESLSGHLGPLKCTLETDGSGRHAGDHRAHKTIPHVGKVKIQWKNRDQPERVNGTPVTYSSGPPIVALPDEASQNPYLTGQIRKGPICACPDWWKDQGQKMHHSPCVMI